MFNEHEQLPARLLRQGDVLLIPVDGLQGRASRLGRQGGRLILAAGERTGHAHVIDDPQASLFRRLIHRHWGVPPAETRYLVVHGRHAVVLRHEEHDRLFVPPGVYEVRRQREYAPQRPRWVRD